ncbi:MAG: AAA family ATPase [Deltaproteobacteria bacterium]|nr:AAA family ATPase [Deltaproteobacteria bacterium]MBW2535038.1 AAA family ATPase [Deltaproteobacteria bacterium]
MPLDHPAARGAAGERLSRPRPPWWLAVATAAALVFATASLGRAQPDRRVADGGVAAAGQPTAQPSAASSSAPDAGAPDGSSDASAEDADAGQRVDVLELVELAANVQALLEERLDPTIDAETLFDVDIRSDRAVAVEAERLRRVLRELDPEPADAGADAAADGSATDAGTADAAAGAGGAAAAERQVEPYPLADPELLAARLALDRQRLAFYAIRPAGRNALLDTHEERQIAAGELDAESRLSDAERKAKQAAADKERALSVARKAQTEAERRVAEERARLLGIKEQHASLDAKLIADKRTMDGFAESLLGWLRAADQVLEAKEAARPQAGHIDRIYDQLLENLLATRKSLAEAIASVERLDESFELVGSDPLLALPVEIDRTSLSKLRDQLLEAERELLSRREELRWKRMRQQHKAVRSLDERRRHLLPLLTEEKRGEIFAFGPEGFEQARGEVGQVRLVLRYHTLETRRWLRALGSGHGAGGAALVALVTAIKWLVPFALFVWWRRRADRALQGWRDLARDRTRRTHRPGQRSMAEWAIGFLQRIRKPLEWLLLFAAILALLPRGAGDLLEVGLAWTVVLWTLGGLLVVHAIDALFAGRRVNPRPAVDVGKLRLRTLILIGRVAVALGLLLSLTDELVGHGTIYDWVSTTAYWAVAPIGLVLVHWWRPVIFHHVDRQRQEHAFLEWTNKLRDGWGSFFAAAGGGAYLLATGTFRNLRLYLGNIEWVRRGLALWFRREVDREADWNEPTDEPLDDETYEALGPDGEPPEFVADDTQGTVAELVEQIHRTGGAVVAVVGARGSGKTTLLGRIAAAEPQAVRIQCTAGGISHFQAELRKVLELPSTADEHRVCERLEDRGSGADALLVDDAQLLIRPVVDGLSQVDRLIALARAASVRTTWVFAFDRVIWQFFSRAREVRPLFDQVVELGPWSEANIERLVESRCRALDLTPDFSRLARKLADFSDPVAREQALERARTGYYRTLWDYSRGTPAVALYFFRESLGLSPAGKPLVRLFRTPSTRELAELPDSSLFVLRAVVQLDRASVDTIVEATMLEPSQVADSLRYAAARGWLVERSGRYSVPWGWYAAVTRFLERRHLLTRPHR